MTPPGKVVPIRARAVKTYSLDGVKSVQPVGDRDTAAPSLLERLGVHAPMRPRAEAWCRAHPAQAAQLPGWAADVLRATLAQPSAGEP